MGHNEDNLRPIQPGEVRNPAGMKPGTLQWKTIVRKVMDGTMTVEEAGEKKQMSKRELAVLNMVKLALGGRKLVKRNFDKETGKLVSEEYEDADPTIMLKAIDMLMKREEGNPEQPVSGIVSQIVTIPITEAESRL